jgi:hypothetical protein
MGDRKEVCCELVSEVLEVSNVIDCYGWWMRGEVVIEFLRGEDFGLKYGNFSGRLSEQVGSLCAVYQARRQSTCFSSGRIGTAGNHQKAVAICVSISFPPTKSVLAVNAV